MIRNCIWPALLGLVIGLATGFILSGQSGHLAAPQGTAALRSFSFTDVAAKAGQADFQIIEDKVYEGFPPLSRSKRIARRIIAQTTLSDTQQSDFVSRFQQTAEKALTSHGAVIKGQFDANRSSAQELGGSNILRQLELPRRYYAIGDVHGVADLWCIAESGKVTIVISLIEGL
jgi:hypothetical protein